MKIKIVIAEDEEHLGKMISFKLGKEGYQVTWKQDGFEALEAVKIERPHLVLLDVMMPSLNGMEVLNAIKSDRQLQDIVVVMLTAKANENDVVEALSSGAADYVVKPFRPAELLIRVKRLVPIPDLSNQ